MNLKERMGRASRICVGPQAFIMLWGMNVQKHILSSAPSCDVVAALVKAQPPKRSSLAIWVASPFITSPRVADVVG